MISCKKGIMLVMVACSVFAGCKKYLDAKSDQSLVVPATIRDLQSLLDDYLRINRMDGGAMELSSDNYYITYATWSGLAQYEKNIYTWEKANLFAPGNGNEWAKYYGFVYKANVVLGSIDGIDKNSGTPADWNNTKGSALFVRARVFFQVALLWAAAYDVASAPNDPGIPLRLDADFNTPSFRASVRDTYDQIIADLKTGIPLLPVTPLHVYRPSRPAAYALLARVYLSMRKYADAALYSDSCLQLKNTLINYNNDPFINVAASYPFTRFNPEVLYDCNIPTPASINAGIPDSVLYDSYADNDLRKALYYRPKPQTLRLFRGNYDGGDNLFNGLATDEVYLMRAECYARAGKKEAALADLNTLMEKRWLTGSFVPFKAADSQEALDRILIERRKELAFRGLRWMDIKRLNKEGKNILLTRSLNGQIYTLPANDLRYALPVPEDVIQLTGMAQNIR